LWLEHGNKFAAVALDSSFVVAVGAHEKFIFPAAASVNKAAAAF
jgi:hypothetical protein